ncbi:MAG: amidase [Pseudomonadota bacterium]
MNELPASIAGLRQAIAQGQTSAARAIESQWLNLAQSDRKFHAVTDQLPAELMPATAEGSLAGVGLAHKDIFDLPGRAPKLGRNTALPTDAPGRVAATVIQRLARHGAAHLATLAMAEYACGATADNPHLTRCINPLHANAMVGGSSSGSAVAVACGMAYGSLGTDTAGSVRMPAATCGVLGLKTTQGLLPLDGVFPLAPSLDSVGVLARTADDVRQLLRAACDKSLLRPASSATSLRAAVWIPQGEVDGTIASAMQALAAQFDMTVKGSLDAHPVLTQLASIVLHAEAAHTHREALQAGTLSPAVEAVALPGAVMPASWLAAALGDRARRLNDFVKGQFADQDILVMPALPMPIPDWQTVTPGQPTFDVRQLLALHRFMGFINYLGLPSLAVPIALDARGLPISVQLVGRPFHELTLLRFAERIETQHFRMAGSRPSLCLQD